MYSLVSIVFEAIELHVRARVAVWDHTSLNQKQGRRVRSSSSASSYSLLDVREAEVGNIHGRRDDMSEPSHHCEIQDLS